MKPIIKSRLLLLFLLCILLSACDSGMNDATPPPKETSGGGMIRFAASLTGGSTPGSNQSAKGATRSFFADTYFPVGDYSLGMYMMDAGSTTDIYDNERGGASGQYANIKATFASKEGGAYGWTSFRASDGTSALAPASGLMFHWLALSNVWADFYAYYPHSTTAATDKLDDAIPFDASKQEDILFTYHKGYSIEEHLAGTPVNMRFYHLFSLLYLELTNVDTFVPQLTGVSVKDIEGATTHYIYTNGTFDLSNATIGDTAVETDCPVDLITSGELTAADFTTIPLDTKEGPIGVYILVPPVYASGGEAPKFTLSLSFEEEDVQGNHVLSCELPLPELSDIGRTGYGLARGFKTTYRINVDPWTLALSRFTVEPWENHENTANTGKGTQGNVLIEDWTTAGNQTDNAGQGGNIDGDVEDWNTGNDSNTEVGKGGTGNVDTDDWGETGNNADNAGNGGLNIDNGVEDWNTGNDAQTDAGQGNTGNVDTGEWDNSTNNSDNAGNGGLNISNGVEDWNTGNDAQTDAGKGNAGGIDTGDWNSSTNNSDNAGQGGLNQNNGVEDWKTIENESGAGNGNNGIGLNDWNQTGNTANNVGEEE